MSKIVEEIEKRRMTREVPDFKPGDTVVVQVKVVEGDRERVQAYEGIVIARSNRGLNSSFTVRKISHGEGAILGRIHQRDLVSKQPCDRISQQWIMSAAEHESINPIGEERREILHDDLIGDGIFDPAFLDQRHEQWAGARGHAHLRVQTLQRAFVCSAVDCCPCPDDANVPGLRLRDRRTRAGKNDAGYRHGKRFLQFRQCQGRSGVARDHDSFRVFCQQHQCDFQAVTLDSRSAFAAVRNARGIAEIKDRFVRQERAQRADNGQSADAGIEDPDRSRRWCR